MSDFFYVSIHECECESVIDYVYVNVQLIEYLCLDLCKGVSLLV